MKQVQYAISGEEVFEPGSPEKALADFYRAFNKRDLTLMEANWTEGDEPVMDNPLGGIRRGWPDIRPTYEQLFGGTAKVFVEFHDYTLHRFREAFIAIGRERGRLDTDDVHLELAIRTSRLYVLRGGNWRQLHHHGSIEDPDLLTQYQTVFA
jgi:hypothetical protein